MEALANSLMLQRIVVIDGIEINLWHGNTHDTIRDQMSWNKIISYAQLNSLSHGENGHLVFSGVMQVKRDEAANYAIKMGFKVHQQVSVSTDFLIIGSENVSPSKIAMVMQLNKKGYNIKIIEELTFLSLVSEYIIIPSTSNNTNSINIPNNSLNAPATRLSKKKLS